MHRRREILRALSDVGSALLTSHVSPDPDAIGSSCALAYSLRARKIPVSVYFVEGIPEKFQKLLPGLDILTTLPKEQFEAVIITDTASKKRVGKDAEAFLAKGEVSINIDHHVSNDCWARWNYIESEASSSAEVVYGLLKELKWPIPPESIQLLYGGILDDTGQFRFSNTSASAFGAAQQLIASGARPAFVSDVLYFNVAERVLRLRAQALSEMKVVDGLIGTVTVTQAMLKESGATAEDSEGIVDEVRMLEGTKAAVFFRELESGAFKVSLRAKTEDLDVNSIAQEFGGGGHRAAAGATVQGSRAEVETKVIDAVRRKLGGQE